jgi:hypothetical protein
MEDQGNYTVAPPVTLTRESIRSSKDSVLEEVAVPEWGGNLWVKSLNGAQRDAFEGSLVKTSGKGKRSMTYADIRAKLVAKTACDKDGNLLFTDQDVSWLTLKSASALQRVFEVAQRLSGITEADVSEMADELKNDQPGDLLSV